MTVDRLLAPRRRAMFSQISTSVSQWYASTRLWHQLPHSLHRPHRNLSFMIQHFITHHLHLHLHQITPSLFHSTLITYLFHKSFPPYTHGTPDVYLHGFRDCFYLGQRRRYMYLSVFVCLSVCLLARLLKNVCMGLDEMLRVDKCRDMDELINYWARSGS